MAIPSFTTGEKPTAADFQALADAVIPVSDTAIGTNATGWTASTQIARTLANGKDVYLQLNTASTSALTASGTPLDFGETNVFMLDAAYWPTETLPFVWQAGSNIFGAGIITSAGAVHLETTNTSIPASTTVRITARYMRA